MLHKTIAREHGDTVARLYENGVEVFAVAGQRNRVMAVVRSFSEAWEETRDLYPADLRVVFRDASAEPV